MIPLLGIEEDAGAVVRIRYGAPVWSAGYATRLDPVECEIDATVQPTPATRLRFLPEGTGADSSIEVISYDEIRGPRDGAEDDLVEGKRDPDEIRWNGRTFKIVQCDRFPAFLTEPPHWEALAVEIQAITVDP